MTVGLSVVALSHIMEQGGSGYFLECEVLPPVEDRRLHLVDDAPSFSLTTYLAYFTEADETEAVKLPWMASRRSIIFQKFPHFQTFDSIYYQ